MLIYWLHNEFYMYLINRVEGGDTATEATAMCGLPSPYVKY